MKRSMHLWQGSVRVTQVVDNGSIVVLHGALQEGCHFGEVALLNTAVRDATAVATVASELIAISRELVGAALGSISTIQQAETTRREFEARRAQADTFKLSELVVQREIGCGSFGCVKRVLHRPTGVAYAMKSMRKDVIIRRKMVEHVILEKTTLAAVNHPLLCQLVTVLCDESPTGEIHLLTRLYEGGEFFSLLQEAGCFDKSTTTFYSACVATGLMHLHSREQRALDPFQPLPAELLMFRLPRSLTQCRTLRTASQAT